MIQSAEWPSAFLYGGRTASELFSEDALWRDYLAFEWNLQTHEGIDAIQSNSPKQVDFVDPRVETLSESEFLFEFDGPHGACKGLAELQYGKCARLFTSLEKLNPAASPNDSTSLFALVIGAGQSGLALGARLADAGVPYLIVEKNARVGDNWRCRYDSLILHDPVWVNHLPYKRFPDDWPTFAPKDMMGDWLESYAESLELNIWCDCALTGATFDVQNSRWEIELLKGGKPEGLKVPHLVFAVGTSGFPHTPEFPGMGEFVGKQMHSSSFFGGEEFAGQRVAIVGATNSAHDIAMDLVNHGAQPTLIQRSSTHVVPQSVYVEKILGALYSPQLVDDLERSDFLSLATPMRGLETKGRALFAQVQAEWSKFYDALRNVGFKIDFAEDGAGIIGKYRRTASGYYIDVGGSQHIIDGVIAVRSGVGVSTVETDGVLLSDGSKILADAIVYATGFGSMEEWVAHLVNQDTAHKIGRCWGYGSGYRGDPGPWEGELRNMWKPTAQQGLWFMGGNLAQVRIYSRYLGLQILAKFQEL